MIYQRQLVQWTHRMEDEEQLQTVDGGHDEAVVKRWTTAGEVQYTGLFEQSGDHELEWRHVQTLANRLMAVTNSEAASTRMAVDYDNKHKPYLYKLLDAAGVRIPGAHLLKGANLLPCLVIAVDKRVVGTGRTTTHQMYTMWSPQGVLANEIGVNMLKPLAINNFPELLAFRDKKLTAAKRLPSDDINHHHYSARPARIPS